MVFYGGSQLGSAARNVVIYVFHHTGNYFGRNSIFSGLKKLSQVCVDHPPVHTAGCEIMAWSLPWHTVSPFGQAMQILPFWEGFTSLLHNSTHWSVDLSVKDRNLLSGIPYGCWVLAHLQLLHAFSWALVQVSIFCTCMNCSPVFDLQLPPLSRRQKSHVALLPTSSLNSPMSIYF